MFRSPDLSHTLKRWQYAYALRPTAVLFSLLFALLPLQLTQAAQSCHPFSVGTCTLPFPSDFYSRDSADSVTSKKVDLKGTLFSQAFEDAVTNLTSPQIFADANGFSAAAPVMLEIGQSFNSDIPLDGGEVVQVFNRDTGEPIAIRTGLFAYGENDRFAEKAHIIEIYPRARWDFSSRYIAVVTRELKDDNDNELSPPAALSQLVNGQYQGEYQQSLEQALADIEQQGINKENVLTFTEFSTVDEASNNQPLFDLADSAFADSHPVRNIKTNRIGVWPYSASVTGQIRLSDFRQSDGRIDYNSNSKTGDYWADFILMLPMASRHGKAPVVVYGHGLGTNKESMLLTVAYPNAEKGLASIVIDQANHGSRAEDDDGGIRDILNPRQVNRVAGMMAQSSLDLVSVVKALKTSLADLDVVPGKNNWWNRRFYSGGLNTADIDSERIYYQGTSMGGVLGSSFVAIAPELQSAFLQVTGVGLGNILSHSTLFESFGFNNLIPQNATAGESALFMHALQQYVDKADAINFAQYIRNPINGRQSRGLVVQYGMGDQVVFNRSTEALAELAELPLTGNVLQDIPYLDHSENYVNGYGLVQTRPLIFTGGLLDNILAHASFIRIDSIQALKRWVDDSADD